MQQTDLSGNHPLGQRQNLPTNRLQSKTNKIPVAQKLIPEID